MSTTLATSWPEANQRYLMAALGVVREALERHIVRSQGKQEPETTNGSCRRESAAQQALKEAAVPSPSALETLCTMFGLSAFERDLLLLCAGIELDSISRQSAPKRKAIRREPFPRSASRWPLCPKLTGAR